MPASCTQRSCLSANSKSLMLVATLMSFVLLTGVASSALAQSAPENLDLSSTDTHSASGQLQQPVNIIVGGQSVAVSNTDHLTVAEHIAVGQVLQTNTQSIVISADRVAVGGTVNLTSLLSGGASVSTLNIPTGVTAYHDFGSGSPLNVLGNFVNSGTFYGFSSSNSVTTAVIQAANITNQTTGLITTNSIAGLPQFNNAVSALNLQLVASNNFINSGVISSAGSLSVIAGGSITNSTLNAITNTQPIMQAFNSLNLISGVGSLVNEGTLSSLRNNINISSIVNESMSSLISHTGSVDSIISALPGANLSVVNTAGTIEAVTGSINFLDSYNLGARNLSVTGGDLLASEVNFNARGGTVNVDVGNVTGVVNTNAGSAFITTAAPNLMLGKTIITGDPVYDNIGGNTYLQGTTSINDTLEYNADNIILYSGTYIDALDIKLHAIYDITVGGGSTLISPGRVQLLADNGSIVVHGGNSEVATVISGDQSVLIQAQQNVTLHSHVAVQSQGSVNIEATTGNVVMCNNVSVMSNFFNNQPVTVTAGQNISIGQCSYIGGDNVTLTANGGNVTVGRDSKVIASTSVLVNGTDLQDVILGRNSLIGMEAPGGGIIEEGPGEILLPQTTVKIDTASGSISMEKGSTIRGARDVELLSAANITMEKGTHVISTDRRVDLQAAGSVIVRSSSTQQSGISADDGIGISALNFTLGPSGSLYSAGPINVIGTGTGSEGFIRVQSGASVSSTVITLSATNVSNAGFIGSQSFGSGQSINSSEWIKRGVPDVGTFRYGIGIQTENLENCGTITSQRNIWILSSSGLSVQNTGEINSNYSPLIIGAQDSVNVHGDGHLQGGTVRFLSLNADVVVDQEYIRGYVHGSANGTFDVLTHCQSLSTFSITATNGNINLRNLNGTIYITDGSHLTAGQRVLIDGERGIEIGTLFDGEFEGEYSGVVIRSGVLKPGFSEFNTNFDSFDVSAFQSNGGVDMISRSGAVLLGAAIDVTSLGGSIQLFARDNIEVGEHSTFLTQAGNIVLNGTGNIILHEDSCFTAVGRGVPGSDPIPVGTNELPFFIGGDIAIDIKTLNREYGYFLRNSFDMSRTPDGQQVITDNVSVHGSNLQIANGGTINMTATGLGQIYASNSTVSANGAVIYIDPPGNFVSFNNIGLFAFGPGFLHAPVVPPGKPPVLPVPPGGPPGPPGGPRPTVPPAPPTTSTVLPTDSTARHIPIVFSPQALKPQVIPMEIPGEVDPETRTQFVATSNCQPYLLESKDKNNNPCLSIVAAGGTVIEAVYDKGGTVPQGLYGSKLANRTLSLKEGRMVVISGPDQELKVRTNNAEIALAPGSINVIEQLASGTTRVNVMSGNLTKITMATRDRGGVGMTASPGEEILIGAEEEELIPDDGVGRELVEAKVVLLGKSTDSFDPRGATSSNPRAQKHDLNRRVKVEKSKFDVAKMGDQDKLFVCLSCTQINCKSGSCEKTRSRLGDLLHRKQSSPDDNDGSRLGTSPIKPIAFVGPAVSPSAPRAGVHTVNTDGAVGKYLHGKSVGIEANKVTAADGEQIIFARKETSMRIGEHLLNIKPGATVLVRKDGDVVSVCNIWDAKPGSVCAYFGKRTLNLNVGEEVTVGPKVSVPSKVVKESNVSRRQVRNLKLSDSENVMLAEVSIPSLLGKSTLLRQIAHSKDADDRIMMRKLTKMGAIISMVGYRRGAYSSLNP